MNIPYLYYNNSGKFYYIIINHYPNPGDTHTLLSAKNLSDAEWAVSNIDQAITDALTFGVRFIYTRWLGNLSSSEILALIQAVKPSITITASGAYCSKCNSFNEYVSGPYICTGCKIWTQP